jgi:hypothetical protein
MVKGKSAGEIRQTFNIVNDFTPEEEVINSDSVLSFGQDDRLTHCILGSNQGRECEPFVLSDTRVVPICSRFAFCVRNGLRIVN